MKVVNRECVEKFKEKILIGKKRTIIFKSIVCCGGCAVGLSLIVNLILLPLAYYVCDWLDIDMLTEYFKPALTPDLARVYFFFIIFLCIISCVMLGIDKSIKYRYLIACILLFLLVCGKFTGSSIGAFDTMLYGNTSEYRNTTVLGRPQGIRADEWAIEKPFYFAQAAKGIEQPYYNYNLMIDGADMVVMAFSPVRDIIITAKPALIGFLFLPVEYAFSFYWNFRIIFLLLSTYELAVLLLKNKKIAVCAAIALLFSPPIQWLFSQWLIDIIISGQYIVVFWFYLLKSKSIYLKLVWAILLAGGCNAYIYVMYPAAQIPFLYFFGGIAIYFGVKFNWKKVIKENWIYIIVCGIIVGGMGLHFLNMSHSALSTMMNTVYPGGNRVWGTFSWDYELLPFMNLFTSLYKDSVYLNNCETAQFVYFLPFQIICLIWVLKEKNKNTQQRTFILILSSITLMLYILAKLPVKTIFSEVMLLGMSYPRRLYYAIGYGFFWLLWLMILEMEFIKIKKNNKKIAIIIITISVLCMAMYSPILREYFEFGKTICGTMILLGVCLAYGYLGYLFIGETKQRKRFICIYILVNMFQTIMINPITVGMDSVYEKESLKAVREIASKDPNARWITSGNAGIGNLVSAQGVKRCSGYYYYPDIAMMEIIDPNKKYVNLWNSFSAVDMRVTLGENYVESPNKDVALTVWIDFETADTLGIRYIYDMGTISDELLSTGMLDAIYTDSVDKVTIYKILEKET